MIDAVFRPRLLMSVILLAGAALCFTSSSAYALGDYEETEEAPDGVPAHQGTVGAGDLLRITGSLNPVAGDRIDTYSLVVTDPSTFYATLNPNVDSSAFAGFHSRLYLWTATGEPLLGNEDSPLGPTIADPLSFNALTSRAVSTEASAITLVAGETYLLSVATSSSDPQDASLNDLIDLPGDSGELVGPNPAAGDFDHWANSFVASLDFNGGDMQGDADFYTIALQGVVFSQAIPEPSAFFAWLLIATSLACRRRR